MKAESLAHYRIIKKLGEGGMGEVYLAQDTKLDRKVAIKVVGADSVANENAKRRLVREARAAAKLEHANICHIYDVSEEDGVTFIVMQYIEGETLADKLKDKKLSPRSALDLARQAAEALAEAHAHGIVHRDIKPQNIMITSRGQVKVLDFGLCKQMQPSGDVDNEALTMSLISAPNSIIGTMPYMSPEQVRGEPVDTSSDIFSLGVTFYEMMAGKHPFRAKSAAVTMSQILTTEPFPNERLQTHASPELQALLAKMLSKEKAERYQSATELLEDIKRLPPAALVSGDETPSSASGPPAPSTAALSFAGTTESATGGIVSRLGRHKWAVVALSAFLVVAAAFGISRFFSGEKLDSIAVLPFTYVSSDSKLMANPDREYLSEGLTDGVINSLSQLPGLKVIARSSVFHYQGKDLDARTIGSKLNVRNVLVGQIKQEGDELTITAELTDVQENRSLGIETYKRKAADILTIQKDIASDVSRKLGLKLSDADQTHLAKAQTGSGEAYESYLKGRYHWNKRTDEGFKLATKFFEDAINKDPKYALAYTGLADCYTLRSDYGFLAPTEGYALAKGWATLALNYDEGSAEAHTSMASIKAVLDWDWQGAENEYRRAIELNPNYPTAHHWYAAQLLVEGKLDQALQEIKKAQQLDPLSLGINKDYAVILLYARDYDKALDQCHQTLEIESGFRVMSTYIAQIHELRQRYPDAVAELEKAHAAAPGDLEVSYGLAQAYALSNRKAEAVKLSGDLAQSENSLPKEAAYLAVLLGDKDKAFAILQKAYENHYISVAEIKVDPRLEGLRADGRGTELLKKIGLSQ